MIGASQDITDRKAAEEIVGRSERRLHAIIDAQPACVMLVSIDGTPLDMNRAGLEDGWRGDLAQLEGRPVVGLVHQTTGAVPRDAPRRQQRTRAESSFG